SLVSDGTRTRARYTRAPAARIGSGRNTGNPGRSTRPGRFAVARARASAASTQSGWATEGEPMPPEPDRVTRQARVPAARASSTDGPVQAMPQNRAKAANHTTDRPTASAPHTHT